MNGLMSIVGYDQYNQCSTRRNYVVQSLCSKCIMWKGRLLMNTGSGILQAMTANNDSPLTPSKYEHYDEDGNPYLKGTIIVEKCWGKKGLYIASNTSGNWQVEGPFG